MSVNNSFSHFLNGLSHVELQEAQASLSYRYRQDREALTEGGLTRAEALSYLATRLPATEAVCRDVLKNLMSTGFTPQSILDVGAGPGTASLVCCDLFPSLSQITLMDREPFFREIATEVFASFQGRFQYQLVDLKTRGHFGSADLVISSYALNEMSPLDRLSLIKRLWDATQQVLVLAEPGTPQGFQELQDIRTYLIERGGILVAPCTHENKCPLIEKDWCHFSVRLARSARHQTLKKGTLGYEDEKYTYLIVSKNHLFGRPLSRLIRPPLKSKGHLLLDRCGPEGLKREILSKRDTRYKKARKKRWGEEGEI